MNGVLARKPARRFTRNQTRVCLSRKHAHSSRVKTNRFFVSTENRAQVLWKKAAQMALLGSLLAAPAAARASLDGFTPAVWGVVALNAAGGLLVAAAMRFADNVLKTLAASLSIVTSTVAATLVVSAPAPSPRFAAGGAVVVAASDAYGTAPKAELGRRGWY